MCDGHLHFLCCGGIPMAFWIWAFLRKTYSKYFPRLEEISHKTLFGTDWPSPGVREIKSNLDDFRTLPLTEETRQRILCGNALGIWPA